MECEKNSLLRRLAVHQPDALSSKPWQEHVRKCAKCRHTWRSFATSLAVYCRIEQDNAARLTLRPSWERFFRRLQEQQAARRRASAITGPWLAGVVGLFLVGGVFSWGLWSDSGEPVVSSLPQQEYALSISLPEQGRDNAHPGGAVLSGISANAGNYGMSLPEWRAPRRANRLLEAHSMTMGRPSGEMVILPFAHDRAAIPYVMPVANAPTSAVQLEYPTGSAPDSSIH